MPEQIAATLMQALPYIRIFAGKTIVIKYGGNAMIDAELKKAVMRDLVLMRLVGINPILVHGGGPEINEAMKKLGKEPEFVAGRRVTDAETMEIVEMVLTGKTNKSIVAHLNSEGVQAVGLSGKDANLLIAAKDTDNGDLGFVGKITHVNPEIIHVLTQNGYIPVISSVAVGADGQAYNVNADTAAAALAAALHAEKLILMTDVEGLYRDFSDKSSLVSEMTTSEARQWIAEGIVDKGMIPKLEACAAAVEDGVPRAHIIDGRRAHALLIELFTDSGIGTMVR
ncbi:acetylglutamate kinase [Armatimonas sp.]|uniref:acetylglutamate kinase n=1 Tax=Armatimonas sp. TaxID=1872638 RepID=UPI0037520842